MVAAGLIFGDLKAEYYSDQFANDPRIDFLRNKMQVIEDPQFSKDYLAADKRSITNAIQVFFNDGSQTDKIIVEYPIGHKRRREEGIPMLMKKFEHNANLLYSPDKVANLLTLFSDMDSSFS